jgi:hypothetical protein
VLEKEKKAIERVPPHEFEDWEAKRHRAAVYVQARWRGYMQRRLWGQRPAERVEREQVGQGAGRVWVWVWKKGAEKRGLNLATRDPSHLLATRTHGTPSPVHAQAALRIQQAFRLSMRRGPGGTPVGASLAVAGGGLAHLRPDQSGTVLMGSPEKAGLRPPGSEALTGQVDAAYVAASTVGLPPTPWADQGFMSSKR